MNKLTPRTHHDGTPLREVADPSLRIFPVLGMPEITVGVSLASEILHALTQMGERLEDGDVVVVAQKIVSKAEGRTTYLPDVVPGPEATELARKHEKDPRVLEVVLREARRVVRASGGVIITETRHGYVCANSGVDRSNAGGPDRVILLPLDPDASAHGLRSQLASETGCDVAVVITDTFGRAWREGQTNVAIGLAGMEPFVTYAGQLDPDAYELRVTEIAIADEVAGAAELLMGKLLRRPVAILRGLPFTKPTAGVESGAARYVREETRDLFR